MPRINLCGPCPCCHFLTLSSRYDWCICPVCFWEDDELEDGYSFANDMTLEEGQASFRLIGACDPAMLPNVRFPFEDEICPK